MKKIFIVYAHYDDASFNAAIKKTFIETAKEKGHEVDCVDLYKEKFDPIFLGELRFFCKTNITWTTCMRDFSETDCFTKLVAMP